MTPVSPALAKRVCDRLAAEGYRPIIVGGVAIEIAGFGATKDADVLVPVEQFDSLEYAKGEGLEIFSTTGRIANGRVTLEDGTAVPFDILNPSNYVGKSHSGEEFFRFVEEAGSKKTKYGQVAAPAVVTYTRLLVSGAHGEAYLERMIRDLDEGAPEKWLAEAIRIARRFGTESEVRVKVEKLKEIRRNRSR
jgi:hypothetical protein